MYALVKVATDRQSGCEAERQLWVAAGSPREAIDAVLAKVPLGWAASLSSDLLTAEQLDTLKLRAGDARELAF